MNLVNLANQISKIFIACGKWKTRKKRTRIINQLTNRLRMSRLDCSRCFFCFFFWRKPGKPQSQFPESKWLLRMARIFLFALYIYFLYKKQYNVIPCCCNIYWHYAIFWLCCGNFLIKKTHKNKFPIKIFNVCLNLFNTWTTILLVLYVNSLVCTFSF